MSSRGDAMDTDVVERGRKKQRPAKAPALLRGAYTSVVSLDRATRDACRDARPPVAPPALRRPGDDATYLDFLRRTFVAALEPLPRDADTTAACGMDEVIVRALGYHFKTHPSPSNVLCNGARRKGPRPGGGANNRPAAERDREKAPEPTNADARREGRRPLVAPDVDIVHESAAIENLRGDTWRTYVERAGDQLAFHLLTRASVFVVAGTRDGTERGAAGYLQLCGKPVSVAARARQMALARAAKREGARKQKSDARGGDDAEKKDEGASERRRASRRAREVRAREVRALGDPRGPRGRRERCAKTETRGGKGDGTEKHGDGMETREPREPREPRETPDAAPRSTSPRARQNALGSEASPGTSAAPSSAAARLLRRASGFVRGVITANPFMRAKPATTARDSPPRERRAAVPSPGADGGCSFRADDRPEGSEGRAVARSAVSEPIGVVSESAILTEGRAPCVPQRATAAVATLSSKPPRPSSWRRRRAAKAGAAPPSVDAGAADKVGDANALPSPAEFGTHQEDSTEMVPETPDASHDSGHGSVFFPGAARFPRRRAERGRDAGGERDSDADSGAGWERLGAAADEDPMAFVDAIGDRSDDTDRRSSFRAEAAGSLRQDAKAEEEKRARLARARLEASGGEGESKPGSVSFDASAFAHKTSFARRPGLPRGHILNVSGRGPRGARRLYAHVFSGSPETSSGFRSSAPKKTRDAADVFFSEKSVAQGERGANARKADAARRVPRRDREALLPLLQLMLHRARRCPYGALLDAHCPMPAGVARRLGERGETKVAGADFSINDSSLREDFADEDDGGDGMEERLPTDADARSDSPKSSEAERVVLETGDPFGGNAAAGNARLLSVRHPRLRGEPASREPPSLLASFVPPRAVASFLWAAIRRVAPRETLGGRRSRASLRRFLLRLTSLRRSERCTLHEAMRGARTEEFPWLFGRRGSFAEDVSSTEWKKTKKRAGRSGPVTAYLARRRRLRRWFRFLLAEVAVPLLRAHFYCTETEANRNRLFFYRKGVWARLTAAHLAATTEDEAGETKAPAPMRLSGGAPVDPAAAATTARKPYARLKKPSARYALQRHLLGFSRLRLLPKSTGLRPVAMLGRPAVASFAPPGGRERARRGAARAAGRITLAFRPVNAGLQSVFDVLRHESKRRPEVMGANVSDYHDARARLVPFIRRWRARQRRLVRERTGAARTEGAFGAFDRGPENNENNEKRSSSASRSIAGPEPVVEKPFIVAADVKGAFDSIPLDLLERVAAELVEAPAYDVRRVTRVTGGAGGVRAKTTREATRAPSFSTRDVLSSERVPSSVPSSGVCVDLASPARVHRARVLELLHEHLRKNVVRSGGVYLLQKVGIPQGSVLSTLLCGVFYAHLENAHGLREGGVESVDGRAGLESSRAGSSREASEAVNPYASDSSRAAFSPKRLSANTDTSSDGVLCRWTDDLLYLSASRAPAERFLRVATRGFEEYGCVMNAGKTSVNFDVARDDRDDVGARRHVRREQTTGARACVAWCGLLVDSETLECTVDYARYAGDRAREAVTTPGRLGGGASVGDPYKNLGAKVVAYLRPKAIPLLYDSSVNSPLTARLNVYQNFLVAAVKLHCYVAATAPSGTRGPCAARVCAALAEGIGYMERATERANSARGVFVERTTEGTTNREGRKTRKREKRRAVAKTHVRFLGLSAFLATFSRKKTRHAGTVRALRAALATPEMRACARRLKPVLEDPRNDVFGEIRF